MRRIVGVLWETRRLHKDFNELRVMRVRTKITGNAQCSKCPAQTTSELGSGDLMDCKCEVGYTAASDGLQCSACDARSGEAPPRRPVPGLLFSF